MIKKIFLDSVLIMVFISFAGVSPVRAQDGPTGETQVTMDTTTQTPAADTTAVTPPANTTAPATNAVGSPTSAATTPANTGSTGAQSGFVALAPIPGLTDPGTSSAVNSGNLAAFFNNLYKYLIGLAGVLAVIEIIWGGLEISTKDSVSKKQDGKERITQAILGLVLVLSPVLVFSIINPSILNLSVNLPKLDTKSGVPVQTINSSVPTTIGSGTACNGLINSGKTCTQTVFNEGTYSAPPPGASCYQLANAIPAGQNGAGDTYMCFVTNTACTQALRSKSYVTVTAPSGGTSAACSCTPGTNSPCS